MKYLVCVAPDGSFEVWFRSSWDGWCIENEYALSPFRSFRASSPDSWGREVLGEL